MRSAAFPGSLPLPTIDLRRPHSAQRRLEVGLVVLALVSLLAGDATARGERRFTAGVAPDQFHGLGELGEITVNHVGLSLVDGGTKARSVFGQRQTAPQRSVRGRGNCPVEGYLDFRSDLRGIPDWALNDLGECRPGGSSRKDLIPRISIEGTFFNVGYGVELDKENKGLFLGYGAFTLGVGDSPTGAMIFNGASFHLPQWMPGSRLLPRRIREDLEVEVGIMFDVDTIDLSKLKPQFGVGVKLLEW